MTYFDPTNIMILRLGSFAALASPWPRKSPKWPPIIPLAPYPLPPIRAHMFLNLCQFDHPYKLLLLFCQRNLGEPVPSSDKGVLITEGTRLEDSGCTQNDTLIPTP